MLRSALNLLVSTALVGTCTLTCVRLAEAQFMFLDRDGDGLYTAGDQVEAGGKMDLYLDTTGPDANGGSCLDGTPLEFYSFSVNLQALEVPILTGTVTCAMPEMIALFPPVIDRYAVSASYYATTAFPPGKYRLLHLELEFDGACSSLEIVPSACYSPAGLPTSIGSTCVGQQGDELLRLGEDWFTTGGFADCTDPLGPWPDLTCPGHVDGVEGEALSYPMALFDSDCNISSFQVTGLPPGAVFSGLASFRAGFATGVVAWTPAVGQAGDYTVRFFASEYPNWFHMVTQEDRCTTTVTIRPATTATLAREHVVRVFPAPNGAAESLPPAGSMWWLLVEALNGNPFDAASVVPGTVTLRSAEAACDVGEAHGKWNSQSIGDTDGNGIREFRAGFSCDDVVGLVTSCSGPGQLTRLGLSGRMVNGDRFYGEVASDLWASRLQLELRVTPNPLVAASALEFLTFHRGFVVARLYDVRGRLVATLLEEAALPAGAHRVELTDLQRMRWRLASGVYYAKVQTQFDGVATRALTILR